MGRFDNEIAYVDIQSFKKGFTIFTKPQHTNSLVAFLKSQSLNGTALNDAITAGDVTEFAAGINKGKLKKGLDAWKQHFVATETQKQELKKLKTRLAATKDKDKKRVLRKHIRQLFIDLKGRIKPGDYFDAEELADLTKTRVADDKIQD